MFFAGKNGREREQGKGVSQEPPCFLRYFRGLPCRRASEGEREGQEEKSKNNHQDQEHVSNTGAKRSFSAQDGA